MAVRRHSTGTPWEAGAGYCRALRAGDRIHVSGTLGVDSDGRPAGDAYEQARAAIERILGAVAALGGTPADVVRTRMFATRPREDWDAITRAHREAFGEHPPASTLVGTHELAVEGCVIEIEAEAEVGAGLP